MSREFEDFDKYYNNNPLSQKQDARLNLLSDVKKFKAQQKELGI